MVEAIRDAFGKESDRSVGSHLNQAAFAKFFHGDAYARFGKVELIYDIDRADLPLTLFLRSVWFRDSFPLIPVFSMKFASFSHEMLRAVPDEKR